MAALLSCWTNSDKYIARYFYKVPCPRATLFNFSSEITAPRAARKKLPRRVRKVGEIWCMPRGIFPPKKTKKKETVSSLSHGSDFGDCDGTKPRFRRVTLLSETVLEIHSSPTARLFFRATLGAIDFQTVSSRFTLRPDCQWSHQSWSFPPFQAQRPPLPEEFLKYENLCRGWTCPLMMRHEDNPWNFYTR